MINRRRTAAVTIVGLALVACGVQYNKLMTEKVVAMLGEQFRDYQPFSYPTSNFGLASIYIPEGRTSKVNDRDFQCDMWYCLGLEGKVPDEPSAQLDLADYAAVGYNGGRITLDEKTSKDLSFKALLPQFFQVVGLSGAVKNKSITNVQVTIGQAYPRLLRRTKFIPYLQSLPQANPLKAAFDQGRLVVVIGDVVVDKLDVTINVDRQASATLDAKIDPATHTKVFEGGSLGLSLSSTTTGTYTFSASRPVILMRLARRQPRAGELGGRIAEGVTGRRG
jgi:hypothetical protein